MKIQLLSDLHLEAHPHWQPKPAPGAELLVLAGDIGSYQSGSLLTDPDFGLARFSPRLGWPTPVLFVPGNHDEFARKYLQHNFGGVDVVEDCVHTLADGRRLWVTHGDLFDGVIQCAKWLAYAGDMAYEVILKVNRRFNVLRAHLGLPYWSLSKYLKLKVKRAVSYVSDFETAVAHEARRRGLDGVVCGHIHHAEMRQIEGVLYCNDGDWVESLTALVEHHDGRLEILDFGTQAAPVQSPSQVPVPAIALTRPLTGLASAALEQATADARIVSSSERPEGWLAG